MLLNTKNDWRLHCPLFLSLLPFFIQVRNVLRRLEKPYNDDIDAAVATPQYGFSNILYDALPPPSAIDLRVS